MPLVVKPSSDCPISVAMVVELWISLLRFSAGAISATCEIGVLEPLCTGEVDAPPCEFDMSVDTAALIGILLVKFWSTEFGVNGTVSALAHDGAPPSTVVPGVRAMTTWGSRLWSVWTTHGSAGFRMPRCLGGIAGMEVRAGLSAGGHLSGSGDVCCDARASLLVFV